MRALLLLADIAPSPSEPSVLVPALLCVGFAAFLIFVLRKVMRRGQPAEPPKLQQTTQLQPTLEPKKVDAPALPKVELPPTEQEAAKRAEAEAARQKAAELEAARAKANEADAAKLKDDVEAAKREASR
jgi:hypothetical protein